MCGQDGAGAGTKADAVVGGDGRTVEGDRITIMQKGARGCR